MKRLVCIALIFMTLMVGTAIADSEPVVNAKVDRSRINIGDTFQLDITLNGSLPDQVSSNFANLQKDFHVIGVAQGSEYNVVNGVASSVYHWNITLSPKRAGQLVIPSLKIGSYATDAIPIVVSNAQNPLPIQGAHPHLIFEASVSDSNPYVQSPVVYSTKLFFDVNPSGMSITPPQGEHMTVATFGADDVYQTTLNQHVYQVYQRNYLLIPNQAGTVLIKPATIDGQVLTSSGASINDFMNSVAQVVHLAAKPISLQVRAVPAAAKGWWFPAQQVQMTQQWSGSLNSLMVGNALTRTVTIEAVGAKAEQIPPLNFNAVPGVNIYPEKPTLSTEVKNQQLVATATYKVVYVPTQALPMTLPSITFDWWNTQTSQANTISLPAVKLFVRGQPNVPAPASQSHSSQPAKQSAPPINQHSNSSSIQPMNLSLLTANQMALLLALAAVGLTVVYMLLKLLILNKRSKKPIETDLAQASIDKTLFSSAKATRVQFRLQLEAACKGNQANEAKDAFLKMLNLYYPMELFQNLNRVLLRIQPEEPMASEITKLESVLYSAQNLNWDGQTFWNCFVEFEKSLGCEEKKSSKMADGLPPLYPD